MAFRRFFLLVCPVLCFPTFALVFFPTFFPTVVFRWRSVHFAEYRCVFQRCVDAPAFKKCWNFQCFLTVALSPIFPTIVSLADLYISNNLSCRCSCSLAAARGDATTFAFRLTPMLATAPLVRRSSTRWACKCLCPVSPGSRRWRSHAVGILCQGRC